MRIVCAQSVLHANVLFAHLGEVIVLPDEEITRNDLMNADALIVRSKTQVNEKLLAGTSISVVGTATSGIEHLDRHYLQQAKIVWLAAIGANANSVAEYVIAALLQLAHEQSFDLATKTLGIIGLGYTGEALVAKANILSIRTIENDPPRYMLSPDSKLIPLDDLLSQADIVSLHVPLTCDGPHPTVYLADESFFSKMKPGAIFINAARAEAAKTQALLTALKSGHLSAAIIDVWDNEPDFDPELLGHVALGTPHIAGYSMDGRLKGSIMIYQKLCRHWGAHSQLTEQWIEENLYPSKQLPIHTLNVENQTNNDVLWAIVKSAYDIDNGAMELSKEMVTESQRKSYFKSLRANYPIRWEFAHHKLQLQGAEPSVIARLKALGFSVE